MTNEQKELIRSKALELYQIYLSTLSQEPTDDHFNLFFVLNKTEDDEDWQLFFNIRNDNPKSSLLKQDKFEIVEHMPFDSFKAEMGGNKCK